MRTLPTCVLSMLAAALCLTACGEDESVTSDYNNTYASGEQSTGSPSSNNQVVNNVHMGGQQAPGANATSGNFATPSPAPPADAVNAQTASDDDRGGEMYAEVEENDFIDSATEATSTFSVDVDNASYTLMRRDVRNGLLPRPESVRPEEYVNYFDYAYPEPSEDKAFSINMEVAPSEFGEQLHLLRIGVKGKAVAPETMKHNNLVFLIDVSGSMQSSFKLGLVKESLSTLMDHLRPDDTVGIVVYAGRDGIVLESTPASQREDIEGAIQALSSGGSTNAEAGIVAAYEMAERHKVEGANNRVIILTDGDFNVGKRGQELIDYIGEQRERHISITCMGYGLGNYNDYHMENIAKEGNGNYYYVDAIEEAERVFGTDLPSTLEVIAADVKLQVAFNADAVTRYRLIGYDNRVLDNDDFRDDSVDAGEIGPGHTVTAYYELELSQGAAAEALLAEVRVRHKSQYGEASTELARALKMNQIHPSFAQSSGDFQFAAAVLEYAEILRGSKHSQGARFADVLAITQAQSSASTPKRQEFNELATQAQSRWPAAP